jgi:hypothetical protein
MTAIADNRRYVDVVFMFPPVPLTMTRADALRFLVTMKQKLPAMKPTSSPPKIFLRDLAKVSSFLRHTGRRIQRIAFRRNFNRTADYLL